VFFDDIVGQETPKRILTNAILRDRIAPAYLFHGAFGVGKAKTAFSFARVLNCDTKNGCNVCPSCRKVNNFSYPDLKILFPVPSSVKPEEIENLAIKNRDAYFKFYFDKKASIPIDRVRSLRKEVMLKTYSGRKRVIIIINCDRMTQEAANAFLKTLEEPPQNTVIILTTTRLNYLFPTIISRCQPIRFKSLTMDEIMGVLKTRTDIDIEKMKIISLLCDGSIGVALNLCSVDYFEFRKKMIETFFSLSRSNIIETAAELVSLKGKKEDIVNILLSLYRDILVIKEGREDLIKNIDFKEELGKKASSVSEEEVGRSMNILKEFSFSFERSINLKIAFPSVLANLS